MSNEITDEQLDKATQVAATQLAILEVIRPLDPQSRLRVMRAMAAFYGFAVPALPEEEKPHE